MAHQFTGEDRYMVLYYNQQRDAAFAEAKLPLFEDGGVPYVMQVQPQLLPLSVRPTAYTVN